VRVVESTPENFKVTTPHDLRIAELLLGSGSRTLADDSARRRRS
jgi:2-C-methyl-D-erythritol 4-phosphate cytidylyltransferase